MLDHTHVDPTHWPCMGSGLPSDPMPLLQSTGSERGVPLMPDMLRICINFLTTEGWRTVKQKNYPHFQYGVMSAQWTTELRAHHHSLGYWNTRHPVCNMDTEVNPWPKKGSYSITRHTRKPRSYIAALANNKFARFNFTKQTPSLRATDSTHNPQEPHMQLYLPLRVIVLLQGAFVCSRQHNQAAVAAIYPLHGRPGSHNEICRTEGEVVQILMHGMTRAHLTWNRKNSHQGNA